MLYLSAFHMTAVDAAGQVAGPVEWKPREVLAIGGLSGEVALNAINDLDIGPDGRIYVAQVLQPEVWVFDPEGRFERVIGRAGSGPGEFTFFVDVVGWRGDTLWAGDIHGVNYYGPDGNPIRRMQWRVPVPAEGSVMIPGVPLKGGRYLARRAVNDPTRYGATVTSAIRTYSESGVVQDSLAILSDWGETFVELQWSATTRAFERHPLAYQYLEGPSAVQKQAVSRDGSYVVLIRNRVATANRGEFDLLRISASGDTLLERSVPYRPRAVGREKEAQVSEWFAAHLAGDYLSGPLTNITAQEAERRRRMARAGIRFPDYHPPVRRVIVGRDDTVWLLREMQEDAADLWEVYDREGDLIGEVRFVHGRSVPPWEPRVQLFSVTAYEAWGVTIDEYDVPTIRKFELDRR